MASHIMDHTYLSVFIWFFLPVACGIEVRLTHKLFAGVSVSNFCLEKTTMNRISESSIGYLQVPFLAGKHPQTIGFF